MKMCGVKNKNIDENEEYGLIEDEGLIKDDDMAMEASHGEGKRTCTSGDTPCKITSNFHTSIFDIEGPENGDNSSELPCRSGDFPCKTPANNITVENDATSDINEKSQTVLPHETSPTGMAQEKEGKNELL
ncbi:hypothetical protein L2E82_30501 [Cichorium intybus]|uniref:Uncharacterized protein n=1 Tax=Cichorium intybus TaxID=13427 RepID=A0ACB9D0V0_CICIN|nr:hypothetical protein L2E82_30501 [Cichorium intybus]